MTGTESLLRKSFEAQRHIEDKRKSELAPALTEILNDAIGAHAFLFPKARPVADVDRSYPLRFLETHSLSFGGQLQPGSESLFIKLKDHRDITIKKELGNINDYPIWEVVYTQELSDRQYIDIKVVEWAANARNEAERLDASVSLWKFGYVNGDKDCGNSLDQHIAHHGNQWLNLEYYLSDMSGGLNEALAV